jgi:hypothetical protein
MDIRELEIDGIVTSGHGVASGQRKDDRYPDGTLALQTSHFLEYGLDISIYHRATVNVDVSPYHFLILKSKHFFPNVSWSRHIPPENFYFFDTVLQFQNKSYEGLIYMPDPKTKPEHFQSTSVLEVLCEKIPGLCYGSKVTLNVQSDQLRFAKPEKGEL